MEIRNYINNYFMYMWNHWDYKTCIEIFGERLGQHIWEKWKRICMGCGSHGAPAELWSELDGDCQQKLAIAANKYYSYESTEF